MKNFYPEKEIVPFESVSIGMQPIIDGIKEAGSPVEVQRTVYILTRNESANGRSVINGTNAWGVQSDSGKWPDKWDYAIAATAVKNENRTGKERGFVVFDTLENGIKFMCERIQARGLYIGGTTKKITNVPIHTPTELAINYYREWVTGNKNYNPTKQEIDNFTSMYNQSTKLFS